MLIFLIARLKRNPQGIDINTTYTPKNILVEYVLSLEGKKPTFYEQHQNSTHRTR